MIYVIVDTASITQKMLNYSHQRRLENARKSRDQSKSILKFRNDNDTAKEIFADYIWYNETEILEEIKKDDWIGL